MLETSAGDKNAFKDHRHRTEYPAFDVMRRLLYRTWIAKKPDAVEFGHTLVCRADGEPSLHPKESIDPFDTRLPLSNPPKYR